MRIDLVPERDRFIPGWHNRPEPCWAHRLPLQWQWSKRLLGMIQILLGHAGYCVVRSLGKSDYPPRQTRSPALRHESPSRSAIQQVG
jgi:hypothetical protein